jgi:hypothetical protein
VLYTLQKCRNAEMQEQKQEEEEKQEQEQEFKRGYQSYVRCNRCDAMAVNLYVNMRK